MTDHHNRTGVDQLAHQRGAVIAEPESFSACALFPEVEKTHIHELSGELTAQFVDVRLFHFWKERTRGKALWLRNNGSTLVSQLVDTSAVVMISHYAAHVLPVRPDEAVLPQLATFIASGYLFKALAALADTLPFIWLTAWLRRWLAVPGEGDEI